MKKQKKIFIQLALGLCVGALFGFLVGKLGTRLVPKELLKQTFHSPAGPIEEIAKIMLVLVAMWAALAMHELGHLLMGLAQGFRFHMYVAGFLGLRRNTETEAIEVYVNRDAQLFGGIAATIPTQRNSKLRQQFAGIVIAGPLTSLLSGGLVLGLTYYGMKHITPDASAALRCLLIFGLTFGLISLALFLATTIPSRTGAFFTDRARYFRLIRGGHTADVEQAVLETLAHSMSGQPYGELNRDQLQLLLGESEAFFRSYAHTMLYYYHLDRHELPNALTQIQQAAESLDGQPGLFKNEVLKELAFAHAYIDGNVALARQVWASISPSPDKKPTVHTYLVQAAIARTEQDQEKARQLAASGLSMLPTPIVKAEHKLWATLLERINISGPTEHELRAKLEERTSTG